MTSDKSQSRTSVRRHPFASPEGRRLVELLDANLASLYSDRDDLAHPGMHHKNNARLPSEHIKGPGEPPLAQLRNGTVRVAELRAANADLEEEELSEGLAFFVAFRASSADNGVEEAIGGGAIRLFAPFKALPPELDPSLKYAELKRMYVHPSARGLGVSKLLLVELEKYARDELKVDAIVMETGLRQLPAVRLYEGAGYVRRGMFGEYVGADAESGGHSICLEKRLS